MTKQETLDEYNFYVRKRNEYDEKIQRNAALKQIVYSGLINCSNSLSKMSEYMNCSELFGSLYFGNYNAYNVNEADAIISVFDDIDSHLQTVREACQNSINYWYTEWINYEED